MELATSVQVPPFLSHVATLKSSEYFSMFSYGPPTVWNGPHSTELKCESRYAHRLLAAAYANFAPPDPSRRTTVLAAAFAVASLICEDVCVWTDAALPARSVTRPVISASACVWVFGLARQRGDQAGHIGLRVRVGKRRLAREIRGEVRHVGLRMGVARNRRERDSDVHSVAGGHVEERKPDVCASLSALLTLPAMQCAMSGGMSRALVKSYRR